MSITRKVKLVHTDEEFEELEAENEELVAENKELTEQNKLKDIKIYRLEMKVHQLEMARMKDNELFAKPNDYLSAAHKVVFRAVRDTIRLLKIAEEGPETATIIRLAELERLTGLSDRQIERLLNDLDQWGYITKNTRKWREGKIWKAETTIALGGTLKPVDPSETKKKAYGKRNHGGQRERVQKCHNCGSENLEESVYHCLNCDHYGPYDEED